MSENREKVIVRTSVIGILANVALAAFKAAVGFLSNSIAVVLDAVNNLTDALSSVITIVGTKLAGKSADRKHPFGYGRLEYLSTLIIAVIILYAGITALIESVKKIIDPATPDYATLSLVIIAVAVVVKVALGLFVKATGKRVNSDSLVASGKDALMDSIISLSTLVAAFVFILWNVSLEAYLGVVIAIMIIKTGLETMKDTISRILGERADNILARDIKKTVLESDAEISGAFDLVLTDYGPDRHIASVHIEVPDTWTAEKIDAVTRKITADVYTHHNVFVTAVGVYSVNTVNQEIVKMRELVTDIVGKHENVLQMHGFFADTQSKNIRFDVVISFDEKDRNALCDAIAEEVTKALPGYTVFVQPDTDLSD
ncbi:MAG: cation transporter [Bacteroidales bacterium]|nr:cation transporter [Bacteroidales bacterium]